MDINPVHITSELAQVLKPAAVAIGNFDGIHRGHQQVLAPVLAAKHGVKTVLTFDPHPQQLLTGRLHLLLTPFEEKVDLLAALGIEQIVRLPFTQDLAQLSAQDFLSQILSTGLAVSHLSVGSDFCFGRARSGNTETLIRWGQEQGVIIEVIPHTNWQNLRISSSRIRAELAAGDAATAHRLLGRPYRLQGTVIQGDQRGRELGFPTANLHLPPEKFLPRDGVYSGRVNTTQGVSQHPAVMNIGLRPTFNGSVRRVEVHLLNWDGDLYGDHLEIDLVQFIRPEQKFMSLPALREQLALDCQVAWDHLPALPDRFG